MANPVMLEQVRRYEAAMATRLTAGWAASAGSADYEISTSLDMLRRRSYQLVRDNDYARNGVRMVANNVVGAHGIRLQPGVRMQRGSKLLDALNRAIYDEWLHWCAPSRCHVAGQLGMPGLQRLLMWTVPQAGEVFVRLIRQPFGGSRVPLALEVIEADQCDHTKTGIAADGTSWRMGVRVDQWNRPLGYWMLDRHPHDLVGADRAHGRSGREVPADEILHLFVPERPNQTRGVPWFASAAKRLHQAGGYEDATVTRARAAAALMGLITNQEGEPPADDVQGDDRLMEFEAGMFRYLRQGEDIRTLEFNSPGGEFGPFMRVMLQGVSAGLGISYAPLSQDYSQTNYSSSRLSQLDDREQWRTLQDWMVERFCQPVYEAWLQAAAQAGVIKGLGAEQLAMEPTRFCRCSWRPRGWQFVDPQKEGRASIELIDAGLKTRAEVMAEQGRDFEQTIMELAEEQRRMEELGLHIAGPVASAEQSEPGQTDDSSNDQPGAESG